MDLVDSTEEVVQIPHDILIRAGEEHPEVVRLLGERVQCHIILHILEIDEAGDLAVGVAGDVGEDGVHRRAFLEAVERGHGEELFERPVVEERLEDGEVADVLVGEEFFELAELLGLVTGFRSLLVDLRADLPEEAFGGGAVLEVEVAEFEKRVRLLLLLHGVVETFEAAQAGLVSQQHLEVGDDLVRLGRHGGGLDGLALGDGVEDLDDEHRVRGGDGAAALGDDVGQGHSDGGADLADVEDDVAGVFAHRIVHRRLEVGAAAVVVDAQAAADVEVAHREAHLDELAVETGGLDHGVLDRDDVGHLRADVEMHQAQALAELGGA